ncbi:tRNA (5-methylaminomethyl-2-thiouridine)(34)-methyltransferase MnmD [Porphyromonas circumdentaria]|uniref:tRNA U34 5-methylaminomethyl-2-thiouridine-forming methyltransferase MnmC n=1 Tax=Porphyromonas circumdentaria TaxID=29524 RepID=A0A1T4L8Z0_9PORP|nr:tRNA (5-methylaminomethyl-2-thiouridine)(34)-methyltransferase MnmD [Porphyromonas circumdentaria]MBB6275361.1 tRNA U34 5-methylaminomethyl-2-thiouridine-forming methyltransferase MnmC [Porphyromonas circumdentaria]MDO4721854.1 tRNA (5-methylaminomethyl-2-thiouridine)(34)-methyltransferase MnmD [Porphyromonas circumdentaria]SJZ50967.1 tRNA U34 5-methylaminomethyl-2-thiouridine-forming methyltransferase MnmC [Porphyromonas circumdentaria]
MERKVLQTEDGSFTVQDNRTGETYHSLHGAVNESRHIYIQYGLHRWQELHPESKELTIVEMGFGTGLNALLTHGEAQRIGIHVHYHTYELYPLDESEYSSLSYPSLDTYYGKSTQGVLQYLHALPWNEPQPIDVSFLLYKHQVDFIEAKLPDAIDVVYFDAFSPNVEPLLWTPEIFTKLYNKQSEKGVLTTYCAKGSVRRALQKAGYIVERLSGPIGKREVLRATKEMG